MDGHIVVASLIHGTKAPISLGRFGRQILRARIDPSASGSTISGTLTYPYADRILYSVVFGTAASLVTVDPLFVASIPLIFAAFWIYEHVISPRRLQEDADLLLAWLARSVDGSVSR
jgi:hypothetical protein